MTRFEQETTPIPPIVTELSPATLAFIESGYDVLVRGTQVGLSEYPAVPSGFIRVTPIRLYMRAGKGGELYPALITRITEDQVAHFDARVETGFQVLPIAD